MKEKKSIRIKIALFIQFVGLFLLAMNIGTNFRHGESINPYFLPIGISLVIFGLGMNITEKLKAKNKK